MCFCGGDLFLRGWIYFLWWVNVFLGGGECISMGDECISGGGGNVFL